jgi:hypothetical protein
MLYKAEETPVYVAYRFGPSSDRLGVIRLDKSTGEFTVVDNVPDAGADQYYVFRAQKRLAECRSEGDYPTVTSFG